MAHLTWLDWYVDGAAKKLPQLPNGQKPATDSEAAWRMALSVLRTYAPQLAGGPRLSADDMAQMAFFGALLAFCNPDREGQRRAIQQLGINTGALEHVFDGHGLKLSSRLVRAFAYARAPMTEDWTTLARERCWYLDIPHHRLLLGDLQVRAILTQPDHQHGVAAVAILTRPGENDIVGRYAWMLLGQAAAPVGNHEGASIDPEELQRRLNDFIILNLLYYQSAEQTKTLPRPHTGRMSATQRKLMQRTTSLFVVHVLPEPGGDVERSSRPTSGGGWRLDHRVEVPAHFRWQPHGPGHSQRKLILIKKHVRGAELPHKPRLMPLRQPHPKSTKRESHE